MKIIINLILILFNTTLLLSQNIYFPPLSGNNWDTLSPSSLGYCDDKIEALYQFLEAENSKAFVLLKDGKIVLEKYFGTHTQNSPWQWASAAKTITSFLVGMAQQEGFLTINDTTSKYLGNQWTACLPNQEEKITILHQLTMTSGLDDAVLDPYCTVDSCLVYKADAGARWAYHNAPYTLLDTVIEYATGRTLNAYTNQKLKNVTGMSGAFFKIDYNNIFVSNARSMARFGLLILNKGNWNGNQIMTDSNYFNKMIQSSQNINPSYGYLWWLNGKSSFMIPTSQINFPGKICQDAPNDMISAIGKGGQFLNIVPSQNLIWLRMGDEPNNSLVPFLLNNDIWKYVNQLPCVSSAKVNLQSEVQIALYPNPSNQFIQIESNIAIKNIEILSLEGIVLEHVSCFSKKKEIPIENLSSGYYLVKIILDNGKISIQKLIRN
jgi:CubicO group peptidase (beta-lactamase class C family)